MVDLPRTGFDSGVVITFPEFPRYSRLIKMLKEEAFAMRKEGNVWMFYFRGECVIPRHRTELSTKEFLEFYRVLKVRNGRKRFETLDADACVPPEHIIIITPKLTRVAVFRVTDREYELMKWVAKEIHKQDLSSWLRSIIINRIHEELRATKAKKRFLNV